MKCTNKSTNSPAKGRLPYVRAAAWLLLLLVLATAARASSLPAKSCLAVGGDQILGRHLAAASPYFRFLPPDHRLGYVPLPGAKRVFSAPELVLLARRWGPAAHLQGPVPELHPVCFEYATKPLDPDHLAELIRRYSGAVSVEILEIPEFPVASGRIEILSSNPVSSGPQRIFRGRVRYGARRSQAIWVRAVCRFERRRVAARAGIPAGSVILSGDLDIVTVVSDAPTPGGDPDLSQFLGLSPRKPIAAGALIDVHQLEKPREVARGDIVQVEVRRGNAHIRIETSAESPGRRGDTILLRNPVTGRRFRGVVAGRGQAIVAASAGRTSSSIQ